MVKGNIFCGIAFNYHDSSVSFAEGSNITLVLEAERIFRKTKMRCSTDEMETSIMIGLNEIGKDLDDISYWALATLENPWLPTEDKKPNPPFWKDINFLGGRRRSLIVNHHLSHAASFLFSPFQRAKIITCDGGGDCGERVAIYKGEENNIAKEEVDVRSFITAKPYDLCSTYLYNSPMCEGKLMALAAYGNPTSEYLSNLEELLYKLCTTNYETGDKLLSRSFPGLKGSASAQNVDSCNFAASLQELFVEKRISDLRTIVGEDLTKNLVLAGGACLNLEVNTEIWKQFPQSATFIPPCCDDTGQSVGALAYLITEVLGRRPTLNLPYVGMGQENFGFSERDLDGLVNSLMNNELILVHNGKSEIGPRTLGNRSFISRPDSNKVRDILSQRIKKREPYRPLAPVVIEEKVSDYFIGPEKSPFMLHQYDFVSDSMANNLIGCKHYNKTARAQTINKQTNPFLYELIKRFGERTGLYVLLNTSLNLRGEPISNTFEQTISISNRIEQNHKIVYNGVVVK